MTERDLMNLQQLLRASQDDCSVLTVEEIDSLHDAVNAELYYKRLNSFRQHLDRTIPYNRNDSEQAQAAFDEAMYRFYDMSWQLTFNGESVMIHNSPDVFDTIQDMLAGLTDE